MKAVYLVGAVQAFFLALLIISKKKKITADFILFYWLIITGLPLLLYYINYDFYSSLFTRVNGSPSYLMFINIPFLLLQSPFLYLYVSTIVQGRKKFHPLQLLHFLPVILFFFAYLLIIGFQIEDKINFDLRLYPNYWILKLFFPLTMILAVFYIVQSYRILYKYQLYIYSHYSYTDNIDLQWLKTLIVLTISVWLIMIFFGIIFKQIHQFFSIHDIVLITASLSIFAIGYFGFLRSDVFLLRDITYTIDLNNESKIHKEVIVTDKKSSAEIEMILRYMETEKPWLENKLSIKDLADQLQMQTYHLSNLINNHLNKNFFDFVNEYRVNEVKEQLRINDQFTILAIAYECGFNSKSSFNRIFKNTTGTTPSEYLKSIKLQKQEA